MDYKEYLKKLFEVGEQDQSKKMSPSRMLQSIEADPVFSLRLDHPSESEIRSYISSLIQSAKRKRKKTEDPNAEASTSRVRLKITTEEIEFMTKIVQEQPELKPVLFYEQFITKYPSTSLTSVQARAKFSAIKRSNK